MQYNCSECEAKFSIEHDEIDQPEFCPFCGFKLRYDDEHLEEEWEDTDEG